MRKAGKVRDFSGGHWLGRFGPSCSARDGMIHVAKMNEVGIYRPCCACVLSWVVPYSGDMFLVQRPDLEHSLMFPLNEAFLNV